jgi:DNA-binding GntR family transcriptional regulator
MSRLFSGSIEPESSINIDAIARELEVSQTPIREALARLGAVGLVERSAHMGYRAAPLISSAEMHQILDARLAVEPALAQLAAKNVTLDFLEQLERSLGPLAQRAAGATEHGAVAVLEQSEDFHEIIAKQSGNPYLLKSQSMINGHAQRFQLMGMLGRGDHREVCSEHRQILRAFHDRNPDRAHSAMFDHIAAIAERTRTDLADYRRRSAE